MMLESTRLVDYLIRTQETVWSLTGGLNFLRMFENRAQGRIFWRKRL